MTADPARRLVAERALQAGAGVAHAAALIGEHHDVARVFDHRRQAIVALPFGQLPHLVDEAPHPSQREHDDAERRRRDHGRRWRRDASSTTSIRTIAPSGTSAAIDSPTSCDQRSFSDCSAPLGVAAIEGMSAATPMIGRSDDQRARRQASRFDAAGVALPADERVGAGHGDERTGEHEQHPPAGRPAIGPAVGDEREEHVEADEQPDPLRSVDRQLATVEPRLHHRQPHERGEGDRVDHRLGTAQQVPRAALARRDPDDADEDEPDTRARRRPPRCPGTPASPSKNASDHATLAAARPSIPRASISHGIGRTGRYVTTPITIASAAATGTAATTASDKRAEGATRVASARPTAATTAPDGALAACIIGSSSAGSRIKLTSCAARPGQISGSSSEAPHHESAIGSR